MRSDNPSSSRSRNVTARCWLPFVIRTSGFFCHSSFVIRHFSHGIGICVLSAPLLLLAATNSGPDEIPPLRPPRGELPPGFWEQNGTWVVLSSLFLLLLASVAVWFARRTKPQAQVPPEILARRELEPLRAQTENGVLLSRVSQILRHYLTGGFDLGCGELTTSEFCSLIEQNEAVGPQLAGSVSEFLRRSDRHKFAPASGTEPLDAVSEALKLIEAAETRRAELRRAQQNQEAAKR